MTRAEKVAAIAEMRAQGFTNARIAKRLGLTKSGVRNLITDPDGSKQRARRKRYEGRCEICGAATDGSNGFARAPSRCRRHNVGAEKTRILYTGKGPVQMQIVAVLRSGVSRFIDIHSAVGLPRTTDTSAHLRRLVALGLIERVSRGQYRVKDAA